MIHAGYAKKIKTICWSILLCSIFVTNVVFGSEQTPDQKPIKQHTLSLVAQYPKLLAAGVAGTLYFVPVRLGFINQSKKLAIFSVFVGLIAFILIKPASPTNKSTKIDLNKRPPLIDQSTILDWLSNNPVKLLEQNQLLEDSFISNFPANMPFELSNFESIFKEYTLLNPIFLLKECDHFSRNFLVRRENSQYYKTFEERVVSGMFGQKKDSLSWVSFECGDLLQDLIIAHKVLTKKSSQSLTIHFIDKNFAYLSIFLKYLDNPEGFAFNGNDIDQTALNDFSKKYNITEPSAIKSTFLSIIVPYFQVQQYVSFLKNTHNNASIKCSVHDSIEDYLNDKEIKKFSTPDVITTGAASTPYIALCTTLLKENPNLFNCWLDKSKDQVFLKTISLSGFKYPLEENADNIEIWPEPYEYGKSKEGGVSDVYFIKKEILNGSVTVDDNKK